MVKGLLALVLISSFSNQAHADGFAVAGDSGDAVSVTVTDVTPQYAESNFIIQPSQPGTAPIESAPLIASGNPIIAPSTPTTPTIPITPPTPVGITPTTPAKPVTPTPVTPVATVTPPANLGVALKNDVDSVTLSQLITLGQSIFNFVLDNKPTSQYQTLSSSVVPSGITSWVQLSGWQAPVSKIYHVQFQNAFGGDSASFDYRITYFPGGNYQGHGKFLGQISFIPMNIKMDTGRSLNVSVTLSPPLNFGTVTDPVAGVELTVSWNSPTLARYQMQSADYFITGDGNIEDLSGGTN